MVWSVEGEEAGSGGWQVLGSCNLDDIDTQPIIFNSIEDFGGCLAYCHPSFVTKSDPMCNVPRH